MKYLFKQPSRYVLAVISLLLLSVTLGLCVHLLTRTPVIIPVVPASTLEALSDEPESISPYESLTLEAKSAIALDMKSGATKYSKDADTLRPLASVTKLMTIYVAASVYPADTIFTALPEALATEGESGFMPGSRWRRDDIIAAALIESSNDAASILAVSYPYGKEAFVAKMNSTAKELGIKAEYYNETGLDRAGETLPGAVGSARDMATLLTALYHDYPEIFAISTRPEKTISSLDGLNRLSIDNTNGLTREYPGLLISKTGYTLQAGGNLVMAVNYGLAEPACLVVLGSGYYSRFDDMSRLYEATEAAYSRGL